MRSFRVGGGLVVVDNQLLLAANRRRQGTLEWTPPGGVIDDGESVTQGISREVHEETGLHVPKWHECHYTVTVSAPDMGWEMTVESWFSPVAHGTIALNDPDRIVEQAMFVDLHDVEGLLGDSPPWVRVPVLDWLGLGMQPMHSYDFRVYGADRATARIEQRSP
ncbi:MAG: ADP-ribose pyrophosphatase [Ilumatobacteraceae bacterium]|nr:ADP-ribose pyrophosphatase [Ilumatobacteraceae bacterium]MCU1388064.1 ADP-ribose pyrophosphatase [Ilumatobacteraceae bacterium]